MVDKDERNLNESTRGEFVEKTLCMLATIVIIYIMFAYFLFSLRHPYMPESVIKKHTVDIIMLKKIDMYNIIESENND